MYLQMSNITKSFSSTKALQDVSLTLEKGEILALMGENGAGKSTLMNILGGVIKPDKGSVHFDGKDITSINERDALRQGIRFIHQELSLINDLTVYENMFLGQEITKAFNMFINKKKMRTKAVEALSRVGLKDMNPDEEVGLLDTLHKQLIEIAKALLFNVRILILDEPTTALSEKEINNLFVIMRQLKSEGVCMIYISHKMPELFEICDRYLVLRDGKVVGEGNINEINESQATTMLVGQHISDIIEKESHIGKPLLFAENLACKGYFRDVTFQLHEGEVLCFSGLQGDGRGELAEALFGSRKLTSGVVTLQGTLLKYNSIVATMRQGIGMVQRNRKERSIIRHMDVLDNLSIASMTYSLNDYVIRPKKQLDMFMKYRNLLDLKVGSPTHPITFLSGGNQQKIIISRWLELQSKVYIFDNPTQGIDVGAKFEIYRLINKLASTGVGIIVFTSEYPEIEKIGDQCIVMYEGRISKIFNRDEFDQTAIMHYATGANRKAAL